MPWPDKNGMLRPAAALLALALLLTVVSCGRKTEPIVPDSPRPEAVAGIKVSVRADVAFLSWPLPGRNVEGKKMDPSEIEGFVIYRAEVQSDKKRPRFREHAEIVLDSPGPAELKNGTMYWSDRDLRYGQVYAYRIRALGRRGGVGVYSEAVLAVPVPTLAPPEKLRAAAGDGAVELTWDPVMVKTDGSKNDGFTGYTIYRREEKGIYGDTPVNSEPLRTTSYRDTAVVNDRTYYYIVRAADSPAQPWRESLNSNEASAQPKDMTPPAAPAGLTVVPGVGRVFLTWNENRERDVAGYYVYRSFTSGRAYERLMDKPIIRTTYSDGTVQAGTTYYYIVTAVDRAGNEGKPSKEQKAQPEKLR